MQESTILRNTVGWKSGVQPQRDITQKWTSAIHNWGEIMTQLGILFPEKISL